MTEQELLIDCLRRLNTAQIPYMVVGSMASNFWGVPRSTHDIDFVVEFQLTDVPKFMKAFEEQFFIQEHSIRAALRPPYQFNAVDNRSALKVDFFSVPQEEYDRVRFERRLSIQLFGEPAFIARPEDVILYKLRWHSISPSDRQLSDSAGILAVSKSTIDFPYLSHWAERIGVASVLDKLLGDAHDTIA
jgi:hypothetical protein